MDLLIAISVGRDALGTSARPVLAAVGAGRSGAPAAESAHSISRTQGEEISHVPSAAPKPGERVLNRARVKGKIGWDIMSSVRCYLE